MAGVHNNNPGLLEEMMPSNVEARRMNRELGIKPGLGLTHQELAGVKIVPQIEAAISIFAAKLAKGIFFIECKKIFPTHGCLALKVFANADFIRDGEPEVFEALMNVSGNEPLLARSCSELNDQFSYKFYPGEVDALFGLDVRIRFALRLLIFGCTQPGRLESILKQDAIASGQNDKFKILRTDGRADQAQRIRHL